MDPYGVSVPQNLQTYPEYLLFERDFFAIFTHVAGENLALNIVKMWEELLETYGNTC